MGTIIQHPHLRDQLADDTDPRSKLPHWFTRPGWEARRQYLGTAADVGDRHNWIATVLADLDWTVEWFESGRWARCTPPNHRDAVCHVKDGVYVHTAMCRTINASNSDGVGRDEAPYAGPDPVAPTTNPRHLATARARAARIEGDNA